MNKYSVIPGLLFLTMLSAPAWGIDEAAARHIAEQAAGCDPERICETRASLVGEQWIVIVSTVYGHRKNGEAIFKPGAWVGYTLDQKGNIVSTMPGL